MTSYFCCLSTERGGGVRVNRSVPSLWSQGRINPRPLPSGSERLPPDRGLDTLTIEDNRLRGPTPQDNPVGLV